MSLVGVGVGVGLGAQVVCGLGANVVAAVLGRDGKFCWLLISGARGSDRVLGMLGTCWVCLAFKVSSFICGRDSHRSRWRGRRYS